MELSLEKIKSLSSKEYLKNRNEIRDFLYRIRSTIYKNKKIEESKIIKRKFRPAINQDFKIIKAKHPSKNKKTLHVFRNNDSKDYLSSQTKLCFHCKEYKPFSEFYKNDVACYDCRHLPNSSYDMVILYGDGKECKQCLDFKKWKDFSFSPHAKARKSSICRDCANLNTKLRRLSNINIRLTSNLRNRINTVLRGNNKSASTEELVGCSIEFLKEHIARQFKDNMSWDNYGTGKNGKGMREWHVDHIIPCAKFDLSKSEEQHKCFHFSNLQPMWAKLNLKKNKYL
jgi:hypothetical protein